MTDETVLVPRNLNYSARRYHTDHDCYNTSEGAREVSLERAKQMDLTECKICSGEAEISGGGDRSLYNAALAYGRDQEADDD